MVFKFRHVLLAASVCAGQAPLGARAAQEPTRADFMEMRSEILLLRKQVESLSRQVAQGKSGTAVRRVPPQVTVPAAAQPPAAATQETTVLPSHANAAPQRAFMERKTGKTLTFYVPSGEITAYGNFDVSLDGTTKGIGGYIGLEWPHYGALLIGKTDAPYKQSTARLNPFIGMVGDYAAIMGNTGGDNRVEFATRLDHAIWYDSPEVAGLKFNALFSPGQNRASNSDNIAAGEADCTGGNIPGSGGSLPIGCNDGAFADAVSASLSYTRGPLYVVAAYERHRRVNRSSDLTGYYANPPARLFNADTADEDAAKVGVQYTFPTRTTLSAIFEDMHRYVPSSLDFQNERQRTGTWLAVTQFVTKRDSLSAGWAHAGRAPGDPGQHNTSLVVPPFGQPGDGVGGAHANNAADLFTVALLHDLTGGLSAYGDWALITNGPFAHYALGAGGRAVTVDCHDASDATGGLASNPHCWAGGYPQAVSMGLRYKF